MVRPPEENARENWKKDLENISRCGFNTVRCWVDWATAEPQAGDYHFETLDLLMELAKEVGLRVIIQIYLDSAPDWLVKHYPDCRYVSAGGVLVDSQGAPGYCYDHPGVHQAAESFMGVLATHVAESVLFGIRRSTLCSGDISITCHSRRSSATATTLCSVSEIGSSRNTGISRR
jgi:beta-galactosidase